jgi:hypothetical protein
MPLTPIATATAAYGSYTSTHQKVGSVWLLKRNSCWLKNRWPGNLSLGATNETFWMNILDLVNFAIFDPFPIGRGSRGRTILPKIDEFGGIRRQGTWHLRGPPVAEQSVAQVYNPLVASVARCCWYIKPMAQFKKVVSQKALGHRPWWWITWYNLISRFWWSHILQLGQWFSDAFFTARWLSRTWWASCRDNGRDLSEGTPSAPAECY